MIGGYLRVEFLFRDHALVQQVGVSHEIQFREFELRLIARQLSLGLSYRGLEWSWVYLQQRIARMNELSFLVFYFRDLPRNARRK